MLNASLETGVFLLNNPIIIPPKSVFVSLILPPDFVNLTKRTAASCAILLVFDCFCLSYLTVKSTYASSSPSPLMVKEPLPFLPIVLT